MAKTNVIDLQAVDILARTIYGESRDQGVAGMMAVANVVLNRVRAADSKKYKWWGDNVVGVCTKPYQFSCWNKADPNLKKITSVGDSDEVFKQCQYIATQAVAGQILDNTNGATSYYSSKVMKQPPYWAKNKTPCAVIGDHIFFKI